MRTWLVAAGVGLVVSTGFAADGFPVVQGGRARCQVVLGHGAQAVEKQAAADLARCLKRMTGVDVPLVQEGKDKANVPRILVGPCKVSEQILERVAKRDYAGYVITQVGPDLALRGPSEYGNSNAVYGLLEDTLGVHWFMPSDLFEYVPRRTDVVLPPMDVEVNPALRFHYFSGLDACGPWGHRMRLDKPCDRNAPFAWSATHWLYRIYPPSTYGKTHPEYYPLIGGKRRVNRDDGDQYGQPCTGNPDVVRVAIETLSRYFDAHPKAHTHSMCINDNNTWCQCKACQAQDVDRPRWRNRTIYSDRYFTYINAVARGLVKKHPHKFIGTIAYAGVEPVPLGIDRLEPNVFVGITQDCSQHYDPAYRKTDYDLFDAWLKKCKHMGKYDYYGLGAIIPRYYPRLIARDIKHFIGAGGKGCHAEAFPYWPNFGPQIYLAARLLWNPKLDPDRLLAEFFDKLYGRAGPPMSALYETLERAWMTYPRKGKWFEGISSMADQLAMYRPEHLAAMRQNLGRAKQLADTDVVRKRVAYIAKGLGYPMNLMDGWLAAEELETLSITPATRRRAGQLIARMTGCVRAAPGLWQRSIMEDPIMTRWYKRGARQSVIGQWFSRCESVCCSTAGRLAIVYEEAGDKAAAAKVWDDLLKTIGGTDMETVVMVHRGQLAGRPNLLKNGSFDATVGNKPVGPEWVSKGTPPGWGTWQLDRSRGRLFLDASKARTGTLSGCLEGGDIICYITTVPVEPGRRYAAWTYAWAGRASKTRRTTLEVRWQDKDRRWFKGGVNKLVAVGRLNRWDRLVTAVTAPKGAAYAVILLAVYDLKPGEKAWFDDAAFVAIPK